MPRLTTSITVTCPPEDAFALVADPERRRGLLPDNFQDFRVTSEQREGPGTRMQFTILTPDGAFPNEIEVRDWDPPYGLTEVMYGSDGYALRWSFAPAEGGARVTLTTEYTVQGSLLHRLVDRWFARRALENSLRVELLRLKEQLEQGVPKAGGA